MTKDLENKRLQKYRNFDSYGLLRLRQHCFPRGFGGVFFFFG